MSPTLQYNPTINDTQSQAIPPSLPLPKVEITSWEVTGINRAAKEAVSEEADAIAAMLSLDAAITHDEVSARAMEKMMRGERGTMSLQELSEASLAELMQEARDETPWWLARRTARNRDADKIKARRVQAGAKEAVAAAKKAADRDRIDHGPPLTRTAAQWESWLSVQQGSEALAKTPVPEPVVTPVEEEVWKEMKDAGWPRCTCPINCSASRCAPEYMAAPVKVLVWRAQAEAVKRAAAKRRPNYQRSEFGYPVSRYALPLRHFGLLLVISELYYLRHYYSQVDMERKKHKRGAITLDAALERDWLTREWYERVLVIRQDVWEMTTFYAACYGGRVEPPIKAGGNPHPHKQPRSAQTTEIIALLKAGMSKGAVARKCGLSRQRVSQIAQREGSAARKPHKQPVGFLDGFIQGNGQVHFGLVA